MNASLLSSFHSFVYQITINILGRVGHTEAAVDLCRLSGLEEVAAISEIVMENGDMARRDDLIRMGLEWGIEMISIDQLRQFIIGNK